MAGTASRAAALMRARRASGVTFGSDTNVTGRSGARTSRTSHTGSTPGTPSGIPTTNATTVTTVPAPTTPTVAGAGDRNEPGRNNPSGSGTNPNGSGFGGGDGDGDAFGTLEKGDNDSAVLKIVYPKSSKASNFEKGGKRSSSDYERFTDKNRWHHWQRHLIGTAYEHKCENVLDPKYVPDLQDEDSCELFANQQRFMYSVFSKTLVEPKAADILRNYSNLEDREKFGDSQAIYSDLCDHFDGGAQARVSAAALEKQLTTIRLDRNWSKSTINFVNKASHLIRDHKEATKNVHDDEYYIEKLKNTFSEHKDMSAQLQTLETQEAMLVRRCGGNLAPRTYEGMLHEVTEYATILDERYATAQA